MKMQPKNYVIVSDLQKMCENFEIQTDGSKQQLFQNLLNRNRVDVIAIVNAAAAQKIQHQILQFKS